MSEQSSKRRLPDDVINVLLTVRLLRGAGRTSTPDYGRALKSPDQSCEDTRVRPAEPRPLMRCVQYR